MKRLKALIGFVYNFYAFTVFIVLMFILLPFIMMASLTGKVKGGNRVYAICRLWADLAFFLWGIHHKNIFEAPHQTDHPVIFVFNHISYLDAPLLLKAFRRQHIRALGKAETAKIPVFGIIYKSAVIMVKRGSVEDRAKSVQVLKDVLNKNISVVIAPEGTFNLTHKPLKEFYDGAFRIAIETNTALKPVLFLDAYDRLHYRSIFSLTPGKSRAVFLEEVNVEGMTLEDLPLLKQKVYSMMENTLTRYKAGWISNEQVI